MSEALLCEFSPARLPLHDHPPPTLGKTVALLVSLEGETRDLAS